MRLSTTFFALFLAACGGENTPSNVSTPGAPADAKTRLLESGAALMQDKTPLGKLNAYLDGFHFYSGNMQGQMEAHHYCENINEELKQCVIFDGNGESARIMGVEYIVSERLFTTLPEEEKKLWHSHSYEVKSGALIAPGIPDVAEHELMEKLVSTYGKTWHTWHTDHAENTLPLGHPMLMMGFTADGQLRPQLLADRDKRFGIETAQKRARRADIPAPPVQVGADAWQSGQALQLTLR
ncbi:MAG TPA: OBAP family protein [Thermoanaerobaculia bacterium]|nr:OBAP family protein [Thermoanaerobaculia bacterium]